MGTWLENRKSDIENILSIKWKTFSLEQQNNKQGPDFKIWENPEYPSRGFPALTAAKASKNQGEQAFLKFHFALFEALHEFRKNIGKPEVLREIAEDTGLNISQFERDRTDEKTRRAVGEDHLNAREKHNIFGVPTLTFNDKNPVYIKLVSIPKSKEEQISLFQSIYNTAVKRPYLLEVKRPDPILL